MKKWNIGESAKRKDIKSDRMDKPLKKFVFLRKPNKSMLSALPEINFLIRITFNWDSQLDWDSALSI